MRRLATTLVTVALVATACGDGDDGEEGEPDVVTTPAADTASDTASDTVPVTVPDTVADTVPDDTVPDTVPATEPSTPAGTEPGQPAPPPASYTASAGTEPEPMPSSVDGYVADGPVERATIRVLPGIVSFTDRFRATGDCDAIYWTMRWRVDSSTNLAIIATSAPAVRDAEIDAVLSDVTDVGAPTGATGYLTGGACADAAFAFAPGGADDDELVDIAYELQMWAPSEGAGAPVPAAIDGTTPEPTWSCDGYAPQPDGLPIPPCTSGPAVALIQDRLAELGATIASDGVFGPATAAAVARYQVDGDQIPDGVVGFRTWSRLFEGIDLPGDDLDGNGVVTPEEIPYG